MAKPYDQFAALALERLKTARAAAAAGSAKLAAEARTTLDLAASNELQDAIAQDVTAQKRVSAAVAVAKQTLTDISNAEKLREQTFQQIEESLKRFSGLP